MSTYRRSASSNKNERKAESILRPFSRLVQVRIIVEQANVVLVQYLYPLRRGERANTCLPFLLSLSFYIYRRVIP